MDEGRGAADDAVDDGKGFVEDDDDDEDDDAEYMRCVTKKSRTMRNSVW